MRRALGKDSGHFAFEVICNKGSLPAGLAASLGLRLTSSHSDLWDCHHVQVEALRVRRQEIETNEDP